MFEQSLIDWVRWEWNLSERGAPMVAKEKSIERVPEHLSTNSQAYWYVIHTKATREDSVVANISRFGLEAFNPKIKTVHKVWGKEREMTVPLFPCYIFANFSDCYMASIRYVRGVRRIVGFGVTPIDSSIIESIRSRTILESKQAAAPKFSRGEPVVVNRGALYGLEGVFVEELSGKERVTILLQTIEWQARLQVEKKSIERASESLK